MVGLAGGSGVCPAADRARLATEAFSGPLAASEPAGEAWPSCSCQGGACSDSPDVAGEPDLGCPANSRGTPEVGDSRGQIDGGRHGSGVGRQQLYRPGRDSCAYRTGSPPGCGASFWEKYLGRALACASVEPPCSCPV